MVIHFENIKISIYSNTPEHARSVGWDRVPEYCEGNPSAAYVLHDYRRGVFVFCDDYNQARLAA